MLDIFITILDPGIIVFYRCRHITCNDLGGIVVHAEYRRFLSVQFFSQARVPDHRQGMGDHGDLQTVLA